MILTNGGLLYAQSPPSIISLSPNSGTGPTQTFTTTISDPNGATNLSDVIFYIGNGWAAPYCYAYYQGQNNLLYLRNDADNAWLGGFAIGGSGSASNSLCSLSGPGSSVSKVGNTVTLNLAFTFQSAFSGPRNISITAYDVNGSGSGYQLMGSWTVTGCTQASFLGGSQIHRTSLREGCSRFPVTTAMATMATFTETTATRSPVIRVPPPLLTARPHPRPVRMRRAATWEPARRHTSVLARPSAGTLTVTAAPTDPPTITSVTPSSGTGLSQTFAAVMSDVNGAVNIGYVLFYVGPSFASLPVPYCEVDYEAQSNILRVGSDMDGWSAPVTPGGTDRLRAPAAR